MTLRTEQPAQESHSKTLSTIAIQSAQALVLTALFALPAILCLQKAAVDDADVWWHLRAGEWITQHHTFPHVDPFASFGAPKPWAAYSWLFEVILLGLFRWLGLTGILVYGATMAIAIAIALYRLILGMQPNVIVAVMLAIVPIYSFSRLFTPRPWLFSIVFFALELHILMQARKTGKRAGLLWLPLIFALWANIHIQFVDGLVVLGIAASESIVAGRWKSVQTRLKPSWIVGISGLCFLAVMVNPYGWNIYRVAYELASQPGILNKISELQAMPFRTLDNWCVLLLALVSAAVMARRDRIAPFEIALLTFSLFVAFRSQRDVWVLAVAACAIIPPAIKGDPEGESRLRFWAAPLILSATFLITFLAFHVMGLNNTELAKRLAGDMPVRAAEVVKEKGWSGPIYNDFNWGGYLLWDLHQSVSLDGRTGIKLHDDAMIDRYVATWSGRPGWALDPDLSKAGLVIGPVDAPLAQLLRTDSRFELGYEDKLAVVFVARKPYLPEAGPRPLR